MNYFRKQESKKTFLYLLAFVACLFSFLSTFFTPLIHSDAGYEFHSTLQLIKFQQLETGPFIDKIIYAPLFLIVAPSGHLMQIVNAFFSCSVLIMYIRLLTKYTLSIDEIIVSLLFLGPVGYLFLWGTFSGKHYPLFQFFLLLQIYFTKDAIEHQNLENAFLAGVSWSFAYMSHILSASFLILPIVYGIFFFLVSNKKNYHLLLRLSKVCLVYIISAIVTILPYLVWRIVLDGKYFYVYPITWGNLKYGVMINTIFWKMPKSFTLLYYFSIFKLFSKIVLNPILLPIFIIGIAFIFKKECKKLLPLIISWFTVLFIPIALSRVPTNFQYFYPFIFPILLVEALGFMQLMYLIQRISDTSLKKFHIQRILQFSLMSYLVVGAGYLTFMQLQSYRHINYRYRVFERDITQFQNLVGEDITGKNILHRSYIIQPLLPNSYVIMITKDLSEEDAIAFLNWTSVEVIRQIMLKYNISYVVLLTDISMERYYYAFCYIEYDFYPVHYIQIENSTDFQLIYRGLNLVFYKFVYLT